MALASTPTLSGRRLARELRDLREGAGLSQAEVARRVGWSKSKLSRIEEPATRPDEDDLRVLLDLYGLDDAHHATILQLLEDSWQRGWWKAYGDAFEGSFIVLEEQAPRISSYETLLIPGLLQTPDYARTLMRHLRNAPGDADLDRLVAARVARKAVLDRITPPAAHFVIYEAALSSVVGGDDVFRRQIAELWATAVERSSVTIQVLPFSAALPQALVGSFTLFEFPDDHGLDVAHSEGPLGEWYADSNDEVAEIRVVFEDVCRAALSPVDSAEWLAARSRE